MNPSPSRNKQTAFAVTLLWLLSIVHVSAGLPETPALLGEDELVLEFGQRFTYELRASNAPVGYSVQNIPYWMERQGNQLKGEAIKLGTHKLTIHALNASGVSAPFTLKVIVQKAGAEN